MKDFFFFFLPTQIFTPQDVNWWTSLVWIIAMFLSAVWTHSDAKLFQIFSDEENLIYILIGLRLSTFSAIFNFGVNHSFNNMAFFQLIKYLTYLQKMSEEN